MDYNYVMTQEERWLAKYNEIMAFMAENHRRPSKYYLEEKLKYHFIHHNKKLYKAGLMKAERMRAEVRRLKFEG